MWVNLLFLCTMNINRTTIKLIIIKFKYTIMQYTYMTLMKNNKELYFDPYLIPYSWNISANIQQWGLESAGLLIINCLYLECTVQDIYYEAHSLRYSGKFVPFNFNAICILHVICIIV